MAFSKWDGFFYGSATFFGAGALASNIAIQSSATLEHNSSLNSFNDIAISASFALSMFPICLKVLQNPRAVVFEKAAITLTVASLVFSSVVRGLNYPNMGNPASAMAAMSMGSWHIAAALRRSAADEWSVAESRVLLNA